MGCCTQASLLIFACVFSCPLAVSYYPSTQASEHNLAFIHIPFNFGHTVETRAFFAKETSIDKIWSYISGFSSSLGGNDRQQSWQEVYAEIKPEGEAWGHLNPDLQVKSEITGCDLYFTPQKYWPEDVLKKYIGDKTTFGILRDPAERLVAMFRGNIAAYGGSLQTYYDTCDVDSAVKSMALEILTSTNPYGPGCTRIPQADFFDGPYGIKVAIDNRAIPNNINAMMESYGYKGEDWQIPINRIWHVSGCNEVGVWNLTADTKALVRKAFSRDYELLCKLFNYCDQNENTCVVNVPEMCPSWVDKSKIDLHSIPYLSLKHLDLKYVLKND